nr:non-ribosomal peptide synthetase/type I polyketide synthase [Nostoc sp. DedSLP03]
MEPIAIIGIGCRFPGAKDPESFWQLLRSGVDAIKKVPSDRWDIDALYDPNPDTPGKMNTRWGGFLEEVDRFAPSFFGISPREAEAMDPQQRLLLEVTWEALENAGLVPEKLAGSRTGVYIGISNLDYHRLIYKDLSSLDAYKGTGTSPCIAASRLSYVLDLRGPSVAMDTGCSSSLVGVHFACQSLQSGESNLCLVGGVNLMLSPEPTITFSQARMMAADGRCKTFDAKADGYVRGEGCGIVVLKRLPDALRDGDNILAIIRGSAVNQDGLSNGITAPNGLAQQAVIRQALENALVKPAQISYVEAHGTGTSLGDPIEIKSLKAVLMEGRSLEQPCWIGSVKTNIGHLETAAGIAGLIKVVLSLQHGEIPLHLHLNQLNPYISLEGTPFSIPTECQPWSASTEPRFAGVSSFSFGGTNCHVILEEAPAVTQVASDIERKVHLLTLSTKSEKALQELAQSYADFVVSHPEASLADICFTANVGRSHFDHRLAAIVDSRQQLQTTLNAFTLGQENSGVASAHSLGQKSPKIAFLFSGQGSQYLGMGRQLYQTQPTFRNCLDHCQEILSSYLEKPLLSILYPESESDSLLNETIYTQPALFALEYALFELWKSWGITPDVVMGHSVGEYVAACVAGVFSLEDGLKLISERAKLMQTLPHKGEMLVVFADEAQVATAIQPYAKEVAIAAINAPKNITISGRIAAIASIADALEARGIETRSLKVSHAFHSPLIEDILDAFELQTSQIQFHAPSIPLISNLTGQMMYSEFIPDAKYWRQHTRQTVQFMAGIKTLFAQGYELFLEIGPKPILSSLGKRCQQKEKAVWLPSLAPQKEDWGVMLESLSALYVSKAKIDWLGFDRDYSRRLLSLPTYPFQRKRYWIPEQSTMPNQLSKPIKANAIATNGLNPALTTFSKTNQKETILTTLRTLVANLLKTEPSEININAPFLEIGADSIVLIDAINSIETNYRIKITIRQLFEELTTLDALANYLNEHIVPEDFILNETETEVLLRSQLSQPSEPATVEQQMGSQKAMEAIIQQQLQLMSQQLEVMRGNGLSTVPNFSAHNGHSKPAVETLKPAPPKPMAQERFSPLPPWKVSEIRHQGLNPQQQRHLEDFIVRYTQRTQTSKQLTQTYRPILADNRAAAGFRFSTKEMLYPIVGERSQGSRIWDVDGNEYLDLTMGFGVNLFGHQPDFAIAALKEQVDRGIQIGPQTRLAGEVAQLICQLTGMERVTFCNSGTEAVMTALRLARTVTGRQKIALFAGSYHGHFDGTLAMTPTSDDLNVVPIAPGIPSNAVADVLVLEYGNPHSLEILEAHAHELAAVLVEPVQSRRPDLQPREFLHQLRQLTREKGIALIIDEMITGFRIHPGGAQAWFGIDADIATYGKIVGGGMPIGVVAGKAIYMNSLDGGMWNYGDASYPQAETTFFAGTFCKHPLALAAASAVLKEIKMRGSTLQENLNQRTAKLADTLNAYFAGENLSIRIVYFGSLFRFAFSSNMDLLFYHLLEKGIYVWEGRNCFLSAAHTDEDIDYLIQTIKNIVAELREGDFLPKSVSDQSQKKQELAKTSEKISESNLVKEAEVKKETDKILLTKAQKQLWILDRMGDDGTLAYKISLSLQLKGSLNLEAMNRAVQQVVDRHEALRTKIDSQGNFQQILPSLKIDISLIDLSNAGDAHKGSRPKGDRDFQVTQWFQQENLKPFDLATAPLFRAQILKLEEQLHLLVLTAHHIVTDGWSMGIILQEIAQLYSTECQGVVCQLSSPQQFREYVNWQEEQRQTEKMAISESYWLEKFANSIPVLDLPTDRPRPPIKSYRSNKQTIQLDADLCRQLKQLSTQKGCTLFMTLLSVYTVLLYRLTNQDDIVVGIPSGGRSIRGSQGLVGYCAHLLLLRSPVVGDLPFLEHLKKVKDVLLDAYEHQDYPFAWLIDKLKTNRDISPSSVVSAIFNMERPVAMQKMFELETDLFVQPISFADYDINLNVTEINDNLILDFAYNTELFNAATIDRWLKHFQTLLGKIVAHPEQRVYELPLLTESEQHQLLVEWNNTQTKYPKEKCIHQLFEEQVAKTPNAVAVVFEQQQLTYQQLNERANQLAHHLQSLGVELEVLVGICVERSVEMMVGLLGILKAGGAYVPLDPSYPAERLSYMLSDAGIEVLLTQENLLSILPSDVSQVVCLDTDWEKIATYSQRNADSEVTSFNLAYVIYTSGSTGQPKGVAIKHQSTVALYHWATQTFTRKQLSGVLATTSICFDLSVFELFVTLCVGGKVIVAHNALDIPNLNTAEEITLINTVPSAIAELLRIGSIPAQIQTVNLAGEPLPNKMVEQLYQHQNIETVYNLYGPSEDTTYSTFALIAKGTTKSPSIGRPIANTQVYILDQHMQPVPIGVAGELYIGGDGLARGYLNRPKLTQEKFVPNPFSFNKSARLYKTGDLARYLCDGNIEFLGRIDHQVKIRGFRIEPGEIEAALNNYPQIQQAVVIANADTSGNQRLIAYVVSEEETVNTHQLREFLQQRLPAYMVPAIFVILDTLPLTPNGKIDKKALPAPDGNIEREREYVAPQTESEQILTIIWQELLLREQVSIHDNFFEIGGDSILSIQVVSRAKTAGVQITPKQIFQHQTIAELARVANTTAIVDARQGVVTGVAPLTPIQRRFWAKQHIAAHHYNQSVLLQIPPDLDREFIANACQKLLEHHDALRLRFPAAATKHQQILHELEDNIPFSVADLSTTPIEEQPQALENIASEFQASLNLSAGSIVQVVMFDLGNEQDGQLLIIIHHLAVDGVSWRILLSDLETIYQQLFTQQPIQLSPKTTAFIDWAEKLNHYAQSEILKSELDYWLGQPWERATPLPIDRTSHTADNTVGSTDTISVTLSAAQTHQLLGSVHEAYKTQINDILLIGLVMTLTEWTGNSSVIIDLEGHGREELFEDVDLSRTVGWFTSLFPALLQLPQSTPLATVIKSLKEQLRAIPQRGIGYGILRYLCADAEVKERLQRIPTPEISFNYLGQFDQVQFKTGWNVASKPAGYEQSSQQNREHQLEIDCLVTAGELQIIWAYSSQIHQRNTIENLAQSYLQNIRDLIEHCQSEDAYGYTPSDFPEAQLNQSELDELLKHL